MTRLLTKTASTLTLATAVAAACNVAVAANPIGGAFGETKPIVDVRLRYESVEQEPIANDAEALTARARLGFETGKAWNTSLLVEGEFVEALVDDFNSTTNGRTTYPVVADPDTAQLNRFHITTTLATTTLTLGRQRINIDDQRFVGNVGWRQNEQTFDALRVVNKPIAPMTLDVTYLNRVNRIFNGHDSLMGVYKGDVILANAAYQFKAAKVTAFGYFLDFGDTRASALAAARSDSTSTVGLRVAGAQPLGATRLTYAASFATQKDYGDNTLNFRNDYYLVDLGLAFRQWVFGLGIENLEGNGVKGFTTPLATLHKFQGWADKFLVTPVNGIDDRYVSATYSAKGIGPFDTMSIMAMYHTFDSTRLSQDLGDEVNVQLAAKYQRFTGTLKYADYSANTGTPAAYRDTKKLWAQLEFIW